MNSKPERMKIKFVSSFFVLSASVICIHAQSFLYSDSIVIAGVNKNALFERCNKWFYFSFKGTDNKVLTADKKTGTFSGFGSFTYENSTDTATATDGTISYDISVNIYDSAFKYTLKNFRHSSNHKLNPVSFGEIIRGNNCPACEKSGYAAFPKNFLKEQYKKVQDEIEFKSTVIITMLRQKISVPED